MSQRHFSISKMLWKFKRAAKELKEKNAKQRESMTGMKSTDVPGSEIDAASSEKGTIELNEEIRELQDH